MIPRTLPDLAKAIAGLSPAIANHLWQSTLFALVAAGLALALRRNQARTRYWIWMLASLKFMVPLAFLVAIGSHFAKPRPVAATQPSVYVAMEDVSEPFALPPAPIAVPTAPGIARIDTKQLAILIGGAAWLSGAFAVLTVWCVRWRRVAAAMRDAVPVREGRELDALRRLERAAGVRRPIALLLSPAAMEPGIFGIARPVLAWPAGISARLDDAQLDAVLAHEICHVRRRDNLTAAIHMLVEAVFWFHPLVWWMGARLVEERERACDEEVLTLCRRPEVYAESILKVCEFCVESPLACVSGVTGADLKKRIVQIMTERVVRKLGLGRKVLLLTVALAVIAVPIVLGQVKAAQRMMAAALASAPAPIRTAAHEMIAEIGTPSRDLIAEMQAPGAMLPQGQAEGKPFKFDVVSIRPTDPAAADGRARRVGSQFTDDGFVTTNQSLLMTLLQYQPDLQLDTGSIVGGPDWVRTLRWDIRARVADSDIPDWSKLSHDSSGTATDRRSATVQAMLAERFKLRTHLDTKEGTVYMLVVAKGGPKLKPSMSDAPPPVLRMSFGPGHILGASMTVAGMVSLLAHELGLPVIDKTGVTGRYDIALDWAPTQGGAGAPSGDAGEASPPIDLSKPSLFTAVQEQLGLKLQAQKGPIETLVIDAAEKPSVDGAEVVPSAMPNAGAASSTDAPYVPTMTFDVASVRVSPQDPNQPHMVGGSFLPHSTNLRLQNVQLYYMVTMAYGIDDHQIEGLPDWGWTSFNIQAKSDSAADDRLAKLDKKSARLEQEHMLQALLAERFHLQVHWTTVEGPTYNLVLAKGGSKLLPAGSMPPSPEELKWLGEHDAPPIHQQGDGRLGYEFYGHSCPMESLVQVLGEMTGRDVVDQTGLTGTFDFHFRYHDQDRRKSAMDDPTVWPPITDAIQDQLGLKLVSAKGPVRKLVIDHVEKPSGN